MPNATTHDRIGLLATAPISAVALMAGGPVAAVCVTAGHVVGTYWLSPDLDLTEAGSHIDNRWGPLRFIWIPYGRMIEHRSLLSHSGVSAVLRLAYVAAWVEFGLALLHMAGLVDFHTVNAGVAQFIDHNRAACLWFVAGLIMADVVHVLADKVSTALKRSKRRILARRT